MLYVCGESLIDLVPASSQSEQTALVPLLPVPGGGPFNAACYCGMFDRKVAFVSRISEDGFGEALVEVLRHYGVDTSFVQRGPEPTTLAVATPGPDGSASYSFYLEGTADRLVDPQISGIGTGDILSVGTLSLALEPGASRYAALVHEAAQRGAIVTLDPNIRDLTRTPEHRATLRGLLADVSVLKLSEEEVEFLGEDVTTMVPATVITRGSEGLRLVMGEHTLDVPPVPVDVVDTIGAGDTVMAVILSELDARGARLPESPEEWRPILERAAREAAETCAHAGARR